MKIEKRNETDYFTLSILIILILIGLYVGHRIGLMQGLGGCQDYKEINEEYIEKYCTCINENNKKNFYLPDNISESLLLLPE